MTQDTTVPRSAAKTTTILLFGDQTDSWVNGLDQLYKQAVAEPWLRSFLNQLTAAIIAEATTITLDRKLRDSLGQFSSLQELGDRYRHTTDELGVVRTLLLHAVAAGTLLQWVKQEPHLVGRNAPTEWLGISSGMFTLSALAMADGFDSLFDACLEIGRMLVRACKLVSMRSRALEEEPGHWGWAVLGISPDDLRQALHQFQQNHGVPSSKRAKLAVAGAGWSTVIGPPSVLQLFMDRCPAVKTLAKHPMEIRAFQHLLRLSPADIDVIVGNHSDILHKPLACPDHPRWGMDEPAVSYTNWGDLMRDVCSQVLTRPLDITEAIGRLKSKLIGTNSVRIVQAGSTSHAPYVASMLKAVGRQVSVLDYRSLVSAHDVARSSTAGRIAIVGMAGRGPRSANVDQLWDLIMSKEDCCSEVPKERFEVEDFHLPSHVRGDQKCKMTTSYGCFMDNPGHFDSRFFHISPREAILMDPSHRQFLMAAYEAMEVAGYSDGQSKKTDLNRIASFFAQSSDDWLHTSHPSLGCDSYTMQSVQRAFGPGRLAWQFQWEGPTYSLDAACAGTTASIHLACMSLLSNDIDMAVAGASNVLSWPHSFTCLSDAGILSDTGNCKPFRDDADGYCRADFVGAVVLKRLEDAVAHNDNIHAVIAGSGRNHSGNSKSITTSDAGAQERLFRKVMRTSQVMPDDISYVEMHGTGTQVGDKAEMTAVANAFNSRRAANGPLFVGGVKANIGHSEAAAGMSELLKCISMFARDTIPPQAGMPHALNPAFPSLAELKIEIPSEPKPFRRRPDQPRRILLNNFDAAGGNACMILEDFKAIAQPVTADPRSSHVVAISARTRASFEANRRKLIEWLRVNPAIRIEDVAYTTTARRMHHAFKFACATPSVPDLITNLVAADTLSSSLPSQRSPIVFVFTGQGSHYAGMGAELYRTSAVFRETVDLCVDICDSNRFPSFLDIIATTGGDVSTKDTAQIQLAIVTLEIALTAFWRAAGIEPTMVMGHSLGEYAALYCAGVLSLVDTLYLVGHRAMMLLERCESGTCAMLAVSTSEATVRGYLAQRQSSTCEVACINSPSATVISGMAEDLTQLHKDLTSRDARIATTALDVQYAFHSPQMDPIIPDYISLASGVTFSTPQIPVASTLLGSIVDQPGIFNQDYLAHQSRQPVDFVRALHAVKSKLNDPVWLEIGPAAVCTFFVRNTLSVPLAKIMHSIDATITNWTSISKTLATLYMNHINVDWLALHKPYEKGLKLQKLPAYAWDLKNYWVTWTEKGQMPVSEGQTPPAIPHEPYFTTCAQYLVRKSSSPKIQVTFRACISDPDFLALFEGHKMQQIGLASGSVFCDAALASAKYALEGTGRTSVAVTRLSCHDPVLLLPLTRDLLGYGGELITTATLESALSDEVFVSFQAKSVLTSHELGSIVVRVCNPEKIQADWDQMSYFVKSKMEERIAMAKAGLGHRLQPDIFYGLFNNAVEFSSAFKGVQEAYIAPDFQEAVALITLPDYPTTGRFVQSPYWSEALLHLAGFMLNGNPNKSSLQTFMVLGFGSAVQTVTFEQGKQYLTYTHIVRWEKRTAFCDAFVFETHSSRMVMQVRNLRYQELPAATWRHMLEGSHTMSQGRVPASQNHNAAVKEIKDGVPTKEVGQIALDTAPADRRAWKTQQDDEFHDAGVFDLIMASISQSTGEDPSEFADDTALADLGIDSIMAINVIGTMKNKMGVDLPASFLFDYPTIGDLRRAFGAAPALQEVSKPSLDSSSFSMEILTPPSLDSEPATATRLDTSSKLHSSRVDGDMDATKTELQSIEALVQEPTPGEIQLKEEDTSPQPMANITLLQGRPSPGKTPFYLMADGVGSIVSYIHLPKFQSGMPVYGIDSPFLHCPSRLTSHVGIEGVAKHVVEALIKAQPAGPFHLGGFSAGCMVAFEVCRQLAFVNRKVFGLVLVDLCCPRPSPLSLSAIVEESTVAVDIFKAALTASEVLWSITANTQAHLHAYFMAMRLYNPPPLTAKERPAWVAVIWAEKGLINRVPSGAKVRETLVDEGIPIKPYPMYMQDPKLSPVACLVPDKTAADLGANGWDKYAGSDVLTLSVAATHLDLPMPGTVHLLHQQMEKAFDHFVTSA